MGERAYTQTYRSPDAYAAANGLAGIRILAAEARGFWAKQSLLELGQVRVRRGEASIGLSLAGTISDNHVFTFAAVSAAPRLMSGREVMHDAIFHPRPNEVFASRSEGNRPFPWAALTVSYA